MIVFLTEEPSIKPVLVHVLSKLWPSSLEGYHWQIITYQGKADLESNMVEKMRSWNYNHPHFIIIRDNDGADCAELKARLLELARQTEKPHHVRLVCQELEAWFLGDLAAVEAAYPKSKATKLATSNPYRSPDAVSRPSDTLTGITGVAGKVNRAQIITQHMDFENNTSQSFMVFSRTLSILIPDHS